MKTESILKEDLIEIGEYSTGQVTNDFAVARYLSLSKLKSLFEKKYFYVPNIKCMDDKNERKIPEGFFNRFSDLESVKSYKEVDNVLDRTFQSYVSCWTKSQPENYALWKIYCRENDGVCIVTTINKLRRYFKQNSFVCFEVEYIDFNKNGANIPWTQTKNYSWIRSKEKFKILPYKYEEEIRFVAYSKQESKSLIVYFDNYSWNDKIIISPFANTETREKIIGMIEKCGLNDKIEPSIINEDT